MPELPEVETIARNLREGLNDNPSLLGKTILNAEVLWQRSIALPSASDFTQRIQGQRIISIGRRGKFLRLNLTQDVLLIHLRMSGDLWVELHSATLAAHHRVVFWLADEKAEQPTLRLSFNDARKFGRVWLTSNPDEVLGKLGPEPLADDFTAQLLYNMLQAKKRTLKPLLMEQTFLAGLGNIYTDEVLHQARLHPLSRSELLTIQQVHQLWQAIRSTLQEGIRRNGASIDWVYRGGDFQNYFQVYQRHGKPCTSCGFPITRMVIGQRSAYFCPHCQALLPVNHHL